MKESIWLKKYSDEVQGKRDANGKSKAVILILIPIMMFGLMFAGLAGSGTMDAQMIKGMGAMFGVFVVIMLFIIILISKGKKVDAAKGTRENVLSLLRNDEEVDAFDEQMSIAPIKEVEIDVNTNFFLTADYIGSEFLALGDLQYRFARREDVFGVNYHKTTSNTPMRAAYFFDIVNKNNEKLFGSFAESSTKLDMVVDILKEVNDNLVVTKK
ncbi:MAG: hypothetical protein IJC76_01135 [Lachnospiraceae bacterium]|nr:hypothetical protein [Lachnospiraceae bacterium]